MREHILALFEEFNQVSYMAGRSPQKILCIVGERFSKDDLFVPTYYINKDVYLISGEFVCEPCGYDTLHNIRTDVDKSEIIEKIEEVSRLHHIVYGTDSMDMSLWTTEYSEEYIKQYHYTHMMNKFKDHWA